MTTLLLLITVISSHFETLLRITYSNIDQFVLHNKKTDEVTLILQLHLKKIKSQQKQKQL